MNTDSLRLAFARYVTSPGAKDRMQVRESTHQPPVYEASYLGAFGLNRHWGLALAMRRWDVGRVDLAALGKCGSRNGLVSARASSACEVPVELSGGPMGGPSFKLSLLA